MQKYKKYSLRRKGAPGSGMHLNPVFKEIKEKIKENIQRKGLMFSGIKGVVTSGQEPTQVSFQTVKRN